MPRPTALLVLALTAGLLLLGTPSGSGATFTARTASSSSVTAAADWTPPTASVHDPGSPLKDTVVVTADAADGETGVASVILQYLPDGGASWITLCADGAAPYSCSWNTKSVPDGSYDLRARATDNAGYLTTSEVVRTTVANNLLVVLTRPSDTVRGTVPLTTTLYNAGSVTYKVDVQYAVAGSTTWKNICAAVSAPYSCSWVTTGFTNQDYDLRVVATAGSSSTASAVVADIAVDNLAPSVVMQDPGSPLSGTVTFAAAATDNDAIARVVLQYAATGSSTWQDLCTVTAEPYSCRYDTTQLAGGSYGVRAVATDRAGNTSTSAVVPGRIVDNTLSSVSLEDPGAYLSGTVALVATASSAAGITSVRIQRAAAGSSSWFDVCTDTTAPYTCAWNTTAVADGNYDLRALLLDGSGRTTTSAPVTGRRVDNSPLRGYDVQTVNGGAVAGRLDAGDVLRLTYTDQVNLSTITSGWTGSALAVTVRVRDGLLLGLGSKGDTLDVLRAGVPVQLGSVRLNEDYVKNNKQVQLNATMTASTTTVNGVTATVVTLTLGTVASGTGLRTVSAPATAVWSPSSSATDLGGGTASVVPVSELGTIDRDF